MIQPWRYQGLLWREAVPPPPPRRGYGGFVAGGLDLADWPVGAQTEKWKETL